MEQKSDERKYLHEQIITHQRLMFQIFTFSIIAAAAILGWGLQTLAASVTVATRVNPFLLLVPMAIIIPCAFIIGGMRADIFRWGTYIIVFHGSDEGAQYEPLLDKIRDRSSPLKESYTPIVPTYWAFLCICARLFVPAISDSPTHCNDLSALITVPLVPLIFWTITFIKIPSKRNRDRLKKEWRKAKEALAEEKRQEKLS